MLQQLTHLLLQEPLLHFSKSHIVSGLEIITLDHFTIGFTENIYLLLSLDTLGNHVNTQVLSEPDESGNNFLSLGICNITEKFPVPA